MPDHRRVWRASAWQRAGAALAVVIMFLPAVGATWGSVELTGGGPFDTAAGAWIIAVTIAAGFWRFAFVPYVAVEDDALVVQNPLRRRRLAYSEVTSVRTTDWPGLVVETSTQGEIRAWAIQKSNWGRWRNKPARADEVAEAIRSRLRVAD